MSGTNRGVLEWNPPTLAAKGIESIDKDYERL